MIKTEVTGLREVSMKLKTLTPKAITAGLKSVSDYLRNTLGRYPAQRYVSRKEAYPDKVITLKSGKQIIGWDSVKQWRYVMAAIADGRIKVPYRRTGTLKNGWKFIAQPSAYRVAAINNTPYADYVMGDGQTKMMSLRQWRKMADTLELRAATIAAKFRAGVRAALRSK